MPERGPDIKQGALLVTSSAAYGWNEMLLGSTGMSEYYSSRT